MKYSETGVEGVFLIEPQRISDERGYFARTWCRKEFAERGLNPNLAQCSISFNKRKGTLRGLHYQTEPYAEAKLVQCLKGSIYDVVVDIRPGSRTRGKWYSILLRPEEKKMIYIPEGVAHGFMTLEDDTEVYYQISQIYMPEHASGVRWDDPAFNIQWPGEVAVISDRDRAFADFTGQR